MGRSLKVPLEICVRVLYSEKVIANKLYVLFCFCLFVLFCFCFCFLFFFCFCLFVFVLFCFLFCGVCFVVGFYYVLFLLTDENKLLTIFSKSQFGLVSLKSMYVRKVTQSFLTISIIFNLKNLTFSAVEPQHNIMGMSLHCNCRYTWFLKNQQIFFPKRFTWTFIQFSSVQFIFQIIDNKIQWYK